MARALSCEVRCSKPLECFDTASLHRFSRKADEYKILLDPHSTSLVHDTNALEDSSLISYLVDLLSVGGCWLTGQCELNFFFVFSILFANTPLVALRRPSRIGRDH